MFSRAIYIDSNHALANYNLACVYSIQLPDDYSQLKSEQFYRYNEILFNDNSNTPGTIFTYLNTSIIKDKNRGIKARQDSDFDNLRKYDPLLFDAITLPQEQLTVHRYDGKFIRISTFEGDIGLWFVENDYQGSWDDENIYEYMTYFDDQQLFRFFNLYSKKDLEENEEKIGKRFIVDYVYIARTSEYGGPHTWYLYKDVISVSEIK
jgi:hypothetical protein